MKLFSLTLVVVLLAGSPASAQYFGFGGDKRPENGGCFGQPGCHCGQCKKPKKFCRIPGLNGHPHEDPIHNACKCNHPCRKRKYPNINPHWPSPFANMEKYTAPNCSPGKRPRDVFDILAKVKLSRYKRKDNGYSGCLCDPYGKLGESLTPVCHPQQQQTVPPILQPAPPEPKKSKDSVATRFAPPKFRR